MSNVIFLDVDGVLNSKFWDNEHQREISNGKYIDSEAVKLLGSLVKRTNAMKKVGITIALVTSDELCSYNFGGTDV
ncbi:HAD domain-containing protein [Butyrivibrio proteoclasticus]|uniref:HAD domain-containing protein n=1 Tax=Butyrivibrio proteoclasticus TaxID=43305 RepID=UPI00047EB07B|nr:HAD domain-containing protein [Butyrivibrio proteoclasticus]